MKVKHNKKRNTAFVFEALVREATVAIIKENHEVKNKALAIINVGKMINHSGVRNE